MAVLSAEVVPHLGDWDANGKMMLAHAASNQGIIAVENICGRSRQVDYPSVPAAAFTHPPLCGNDRAAASEKGAAED